MAAGRTKYKVIGMKAAKRNKKPQPSAQLGEDDDASSRDTSFCAAAVTEIAVIVSLCKACTGLEYLFVQRAKEQKTAREFSLLLTAESVAGHGRQGRRQRAQVM